MVLPQALTDIPRYETAVELCKVDTVDFIAAAMPLIIRGADGMVQDVIDFIGKSRLDERVFTKVEAKLSSMPGIELPLVPALCETNMYKALKDYREHVGLKPVATVMFARLLKFSEACKDDILRLRILRS